MKNEEQKILGLDYGDKRIGLAIAASSSIALPYKVINNQGLSQVLVELEAIIKTEKINQLVVGLPHSLSGQTNERLEITQKFIKDLKNNLSVPVATIDERFTSKLYTRMGVKQEIDKYAATAILDTWLATQQDD